MDFYARQVAAKRSTRWLIAAFALAVLAVVASVDLLLLSMTAADSIGPGSNIVEFATEEPARLFVPTLLVLAVIGGASLYKAIQLRGGGGVLARELGGVRVERTTADPRLKRLHNVVEEMAIASGVPMPEVYVLEQDLAINAFAAGDTAANAAVAVTRGAVERLTREELQGVIAHEFSHILNGDMRLNLRMIGWLFGLLAISMIGRIILRAAPRMRKSGILAIVIGLGFFIIGYVGLFAGRLLQAAISRDRERLADASAVQFTRNPLGLKGALLKIAGLDRKVDSRGGSTIVSGSAEQAAHLFFAPAFRRVFSTHPPLRERIHALDPTFRDEQLAMLAARALDAPGDDEALATEALEAAGPAQTIARLDAGASVPAMPRAVAASTGDPQTMHIREARALRLALPQSLRNFSESPARAITLLLGVLVSRDAQVLERQRTLVEAGLGAALWKEVVEASKLAATLKPMLRLPAVLEVFPALRHVPRERRGDLRRLLVSLIKADERIDVFEFCLAKLVAVSLADELQPIEPHGSRKLDAAQDDVRVLISVLAAHAGDDARARRAYESGMQSLYPRERPAYQAVSHWPVELDRALGRLGELHPYAKQALIEALVRTIAEDDAMTVGEAELLRTVCAILHCPLPPLLPGTAGTA